MSKFRTALSLFAIIIAIWWIAPVSAQTTDCLFFCGGTSQPSTSLVPAMTDAAGVLTCDPSYPDFCIPPPPPDLNCSAPVIAGRHNFRVLPPDPHHFDTDHDGIGCESAVADTPTTGPAPAATATFTATPTAMPTSPASTATPTPTRTPSGGPPAGTPTPTATTVSVVSCSPRPPVTVAVVSSGAGQITATIGATGANNSVRQLRFGAATNASIQAGGQTAAGNFTMTPPAGTAATTFIVQRVQAGQPVQVPLVVVDGCGEWPTFVGAGTAVP
jgi:hypothetical protein